MHNTNLQTVKYIFSNSSPFLTLKAPDQFDLFQPVWSGSQLSSANAPVAAACAAAASEKLRLNFSLQIVVYMNGAKLCVFHQKIRQNSTVHSCTGCFHRISHSCSILQFTVQCLLLDGLTASISKSTEKNCDQSVATCENNIYCSASLLTPIVFLNRIISVKSVITHRF